MGLTLIEAVLADKTLELGAALDAKGSPAVGRRAGSGKVGADVGRALKLGEIIAASLKRDLKKEAKHGREGDVGARPARQIGFHAIRGGDIVGEHSVIFAGTGERVEITVRSQSRMTYALGALRAAKFLKDQPAGLYDMFHVLGLS